MDNDNDDVEELLAPTWNKKDWLFYNNYIKDNYNLDNGYDDVMVFGLKLLWIIKYLVKRFVLKGCENYNGDKKRINFMMIEWF